MGLNKFVSLLADVVLPDCNHHQHRRHRQRMGNGGDGGEDGLTVRPDGGGRIASSTTYNSELDIYGTAARFKKSLLWGSLRKPRRLKGSIMLCTRAYCLPTVCVCV